MLWLPMILMSTYNLPTSHLSLGTPCSIMIPRIVLFICMHKQKYFGCHVGSDFNIVLAVDVRVMSSALFRVLHLGTHIIFFLLPTTLLACRVILLNDVGTSSFGSTFGPVDLLADTMGDNSFPNSCPHPPIPST
jgi:hypothetical protein